MELKDIVANIAAKHNEIDAALKSTSLTTSEIKASVEANIGEVKGLVNRVLDVEQRLAERVQKGQESTATLGASLVASESMKNFSNGLTARGVFESKAAFLGQTAGGASDSTLVAPQRLPGVVAQALRLPSILDVLTVLPTTSNLVEYTRDTAFTNAAATKAEGAASAQSNIGFELIQMAVKTVSHHIVLSRQVLADSPQLAAYVDTRLDNGLRLAVENQIVSGDGLGQNFQGMLHASSHVALAGVTDEAKLDSINRGIEEVQMADYAADVVLLNPRDWAAIQRTKTTTGEYLVGNPVGGVMTLALWGLPVVPCKAIPVGTFKVASMVQAFAYFEREGVTIETFLQDKDNATKHLVTVQASTRGGLASFRPASARVGTFA